MCYNYKVSLGTFLLGTLFSILLIKKGNSIFWIENKVTGIFLLFISFIQFLEFIFWIDLKNVYGLNKLATIIAPLFNAGQPTILYLIKYIIYKPNLFTFKNLPFFLLNVGYFIYLIVKYINFISYEKLITSKTSLDGHLLWPWLKYYNPYFYLILFAINICYLFNINYAIILTSLTYFLLYLSRKYFKYNIGELWCFFGSFMSLIMYYLSYYIYNLLPINLINIFSHININAFIERR